MQFADFGSYYGVQDKTSKPLPFKISFTAASKEIHERCQRGADPSLMDLLELFMTENIQNYHGAMIHGVKDLQLTLFGVQRRCLLFLHNKPNT